MKERMKELLTAAAKCFEEMSSPFATEWLSDNKVTLDECGDLSEAIASAIKIYVALPQNARLALVIKQAVSESELPDDVKRLVIANLDLRHAHRDLREALARMK